MDSIKFEWDPDKAISNLRKHGVAFGEAAGIFRDPLSITADDPDHSAEEGRFITVGLSHAGHLLIGSHTDRGERIRIIQCEETHPQGMKDP